MRAECFTAWIRGGGRASPLGPESLLCCQVTHGISVQLYLTVRYFPNHHYVDVLCSRVPCPPGMPAFRIGAEDIPTSVHERCLQRFASVPVTVEHYLPAI